MLAWAAMVLAVGCKHKGDTGGYPAVCNPGSAWDGEQAAFRDASEGWGLPEIEDRKSVV